VNLLFQRFLLVNALLFVFVQQSAFAKQVKVRINAEQGAKEIAKSVAARLQGTERYAVTESDDAELYLHLNCMGANEFSKENGYVCAFVFTYYPDKMAGIGNTVGPYGLVTGRDVSSVAEDVFASFVSATTSEKLERAQKDMRIAVLGYCHGSVLDKNVRADCGQSTDK
jgi:hypothetical protein